MTIRQVFRNTVRKVSLYFKTKRVIFTGLTSIFIGQSCAILRSDNHTVPTFQKKSFSAKLTSLSSGVGYTVREKFFRKQRRALFIFNKELRPTLKTLLLVCVNKASIHSLRIRQAGLLIGAKHKSFNAFFTNILGLMKKNAVGCEVEAINTGIIRQKIILFALKTLEGRCLESCFDIILQAVWNYFCLLTDFCLEVIWIGAEDVAMRTLLTI